MIKLLLFLVPVFLFSCSGKENKSAGNDNFYEINCEEAVSNSQEFRLSEAASKVEYIKLETNDSCLVRPVVRYFFTDEFIFVQNRDHILKYSRDGKFLQKIGNPGRGPGEIDLIRIMSVIPEKKLIIVQLNAFRKLLYFSFDGELLKTVDFEKHISYIKVCPDEKYITYERGAAGNEKYTFCLATNTWDTLSLVRNYQNWTRTTDMILSIGYPSFEPFYFSDGKYFFKDMYNDTVYCNLDAQIKPAYFVNLGKFTLPSDLRPEKLGVNGITQFNENNHKYHFATVHEAAGKVFVSAHCYGKAPSKFIIYDRKKNEASLANVPDQEPGGFVNDWDGGPAFWPIGSVSENQIFMPVSVMTLQKMLESQPSSEIGKNTEKRKQLQEMIAGTDISDNPVLMVVTLK